MKSVQYIEIDVDAYRVTTFETAGIGSAISGWTSRWDTGITFVGIADADMPSGKAMRLTKTTSSDDAFVSWDVAPDLADVSAIAQFKVIDVTEFGIVLRASGADGTEVGYLAYPNSAGVELWRYNGDGSADKLYDSAAGSAIALGGIYFLKFDALDTASGVQLGFKVWQGELSDEPEEYDDTYEDTAAGRITAAGKSGLLLFFNGTDSNIGMFKVTAPTTEAEDTWRFAVPTEYLPRDIEAIPSITGISYTPSVISLGENLGQRATLSITFKDHRHADRGEGFDQGTFWGKWRGRYGQRLRAREVRWIQGLEGQSLAEMDTRHFIVESTSGPTPDGGYTIVAQDVLKLADGDRALAPRPTDAFLLANITNSDTGLIVGPTGAGDAFFPSTGYINIGGKEVCQFARTGDAFTITRNTTIPGFSYETEVVAHTAGERVQLCLAYEAEDSADIIRDLFVTYAAVNASYINLTAWQLETATYLATVYTALITEPTAVNKLVSELIQQAALAIWWDSVDALIRLQVLRAIVTTAEDFTEENTLEGTLKVQDQPNTRLSEVLTYFAQRNPLKPVDEKDNYRSAILTIDLDAQSDYGGAANKTIFSRWIPFGARTVAERLNDILLSRFVDPPRRFNFDVFRYGPETVTEGGGYELGWTTNQDELGNPVLAPIQVTRLNPMADRFAIEAEEMLFTGVSEVDLTNRVITIDSNINNIDLRDLHDNIFPELDTSASPTVSVTFIIQAGVIVGSTSTAMPACDVGDWPVGFSPTLRVVGRIQGRGGDGGEGNLSGSGSWKGGEDGGTALYTRHSLNLDVDEGEIWGGGGGGAGDADSSHAAGGGGGAGQLPGAGGPALPEGNPGADPGDPGTTEAGGAGGTPGGGEFGGAGGGPGQDGNIGGGGGVSGGAAGTAIDGVSFITVTQGPGDIRGDQIN